MKGQLNIYPDNFLEKAELDRLMNFIRDNAALFLFVSNAQSFGIVQQGASLSIDPAFKIEVGTNSNTIKLVADSYALDINGKLIYQRAFDNLPIPTDNLYYWVKIKHKFDHYEPGYVNIATDGTLSGVGTSFLDILRGSSSGFPTKVKFFIENSDGSLTAANNSNIYEVVSVAGNNTAVIVGGSLVPESQLRYVVLGTFSIKTSVSAITSTGIYSYDSCDIELIAEETNDTPPITGFVADEEFYIARIKCNGAVVTVEDKRSNYYFRLNFGDIIVSNKANIDASNLTAPDVVLWLAALGIYTSAQVNVLLTPLMVKAQNLNDVANKTTARSNLGVYSTTYSDNTYLAKGQNLNDVQDKPASRNNLDVYSKAEQGNLLTKIVPIGDWNMVSDGTNGIAHGLDFTKIREFFATIINDAGTAIYSLTDNNRGGIYIESTYITLTRTFGGGFSSVDFDSTAYNRGFLTIRYIL